MGGAGAAKQNDLHLAVSLVRYSNTACASLETNLVPRHTIDDLLNERHRGFSPLQRLLRQASKQDAWTAQLQAVVPDPLRAHCRVSDIRGNQAVVVCGSAAVATRIRFLAPQLLEQLNGLADFSGVTEIQVRVGDNGPSPSETS